MYDCLLYPNHPRHSKNTQLTAFSVFDERCSDYSAKPLNAAMPPHLPARNSAGTMSGMVIRLLHKVPGLVHPFNAVVDNTTISSYSNASD